MTHFIFVDNLFFQFISKHLVPNRMLEYKRSSICLKFSIEFIDMSKVFVLSAILLAIYCLHGFNAIEMDLDWLSSKENCCPLEVRIVFDRFGEDGGLFDSNKRYLFCDEIDNSKNRTEDIQMPRCLAELCLDGIHHDGSNCGIGLCNMNGCGCIDGCIQGDSEVALKSFKEKHGDKIVNTRLMTSDEAQKYYEKYVF